MVDTDISIPVEEAHGEDDRRRTCPDCGARVRDLSSHKYKVHTIKRQRQDRAPNRPRAQPRLAKKSASLKPDLEVTFAFVAEIWRMRDPVCGSVLLAQVSKIAEAWDQWAQSSPQVRRILELAMTGAGPVAVITAHLPVVMVVVAHHGPNRAQYFPDEAAPPVDVSTNGAAPTEAEPGPWTDGPVASGYGPPVA